MIRITHLFASIFSIVFAGQLLAQDDFFLSTQGLNQGPVNSAAKLDLGVGETGTLHLYFDNQVQHPNVDTCVWFIASTSSADIVNITNFETFDYDISINGFPIGLRWDDSFGPGIIEPDGQSAKANAFTVVGGSGMIESNTGNPFSDEGYDVSADVFHVARIDFEAIGSGNVEITLVTDPAVFIGNQGMALDVTYGTATVSVGNLEVLLGDVNLDGMVTLLDVDPLIDRIMTGTYQAEADCNEDGEVTLLDVAPFIDAIQFP